MFGDAFDDNTKRQKDLTMTMPPQAKEVPRGFRYTPPSYLQNIKSENRPWTNDNEGDDDMALKQEERPSRKHTTIDANFSARIQRRKDMYRGIIKGDYEVESLNETVDDLERSWSLLDDSDNVSQQAREARRQRLKTSDQTVLSSTSGLSEEDSEAARVRNMRAQRIREAKKLSTDEDSLGEKLRLRRLQQIERDRLEKELELRKQEEFNLEQQRIEQERLMLAEERRLLEAAKQIAVLQDERRRQRPPSPQERPTKAPPRKIRRAESEDPLPELSLFEEVQMLLRESGLLRTCVASCFGDSSEIHLTKSAMRTIEDLELSEESSGERSFVPQY